MSAPSLTPLFEPRAIALVGASPDLGKPGGRFLAFLAKFGYAGKIYPINPKYPAIAGLTCYPDLDKLPGPVDLVILLVAAEAVTGYLEAAAQAGARAAIVCSSGFDEAGPKGQALQRELEAVAERHGMAVLGPNCLGLVDLNRKLVASFSTALESGVRVKSGPTAFVSQSGAMGIAVFSVAQAEGVGVGKFISTGNEAVLDFTDFVEHLSADPAVSLILGYIEGVRDGRRFVGAARRARAAGKAVAVIKVGGSEAGERAVRSHTGALAGSAKVYEAAFRRAGVLAVNDIRSLIDIAVALPGSLPVAGPRVGIVSMSGGAGVLISDACGAHGLEVVSLSAATRAALARILPAFAGMANPVDYGPVYGDIRAIEGCVETVARDAGVDQVIVFVGLSPGLAGVIEPILAAVQKRSGKPLILAWLGGPAEGIRRCRELGVAAYDEPARAVAAAKARAFFGASLAAMDSSEPEASIAAADTRMRGMQTQLRDHLNAGHTSLSERDVKQLVERYDVPVGLEILATSAAEAGAAAMRIGRPLAVKAEAPDLLHKSDAGAVRLNVAPDAAALAYGEVFDAAARLVGAAHVRGALIQPMAEPGIEMLVGLKHDPQFGPTITVGMGGVTSEVLADAATELAPVDLATALGMIKRLRGAPLLGAFRGAPARDIDALAAVVVAMSRLAHEAGAVLAELDLNPVIVHTAGKGCTVVDGAAVLANHP